MKVINDGKGLTLKTSYFESAILTEALIKGIEAYEQENALEHADQAKQLLNDLLNRQELITWQ